MRSGAGPDRRIVAVLAERLLEYAGDDVEEMPMLDGDAGRLVMVHGRTCGGACDYGCGAIAIMYSQDDDGVIVESVEIGTLSVRGLSGTHGGQS